MVGWGIVADLVVESICLYQYNYTKKQTPRQAVPGWTQSGGGKCEGRIPWQKHTSTQGPIQ